MDLSVKKAKKKYSDMYLDKSVYIDTHEDTNSDFYDKSKEETEIVDDEVERENIIPFTTIYGESEKEFIIEHNEYILPQDYIVKKECRESLIQQQFEVHNKAFINEKFKIKPIAKLPKEAAPKTKNRSCKKTPSTNNESPKNDLKIDKISEETLLSQRKLDSSGKNNYICDVCGKHYVYLAAFNKHKNSHTVNEIDPKVSPKSEEIIKSDEKESYMCKVCDFKTQDICLMKEHEMSHSTSWVCKDCGKPFKSATSLKKHTFYHISEKNTKKQKKLGGRKLGKLCEFKTQNVYQTKDHASIGPKTKLNACDYCGKSFKNELCLRKHRFYHLSAQKRMNYKFESPNTEIKQIDGKKTYFCQLCAFKTKNCHNMLQHSHVHTGRKDHMCNVCGNSFQTKHDLENHRLSHLQIPNSEMACPFCEFKTQNIIHMKEHEIVHKTCEPSPQHRFDICNDCGKSFENGKNFKRHRLAHLNEKSKFNFKLECPNTEMKRIDGKKIYFCLLCEFKTKNTIHMQEHCYVHTGQKDYLCDLCGKSFSLVKNMKRHRMTHLNEKLFKCDLCSYRCNFKLSLKRHVEAHMKKKNHSCPLCDFTTSRPDCIKIHIQNHYKDEKYKCSYCTYSALSKSKISQHIRYHH